MREDDKWMFASGVFRIPILHSQLPRSAGVGVRLDAASIGVGVGHRFNTVFAGNLQRFVLREYQGGGQGKQRDK